MAYKLDKRSKIFIIVFFSIIFVPVIIIGTINYTKEQKLKNRIENSKTTRSLVLNNISTAITLDELLKIETFKEYTIEDDELKYENDKNKRDFTITYANTSFFGSNCIMEYMFVDESLKLIIFDIDTSHWMPKDIYTELIVPTYEAIKRSGNSATNEEIHGKQEAVHDKEAEVGHSYITLGSRLPYWLICLL